MAAILHYTWKPRKSTDTRPLDKAPAIRRHDTWSATVRVWADTATPTGVDLSGMTIEGQLRLLPVGSGIEEDPPVAEIDVDMTDAATGVLVLRMAPEVTRDLPPAGYWDLQMDDGGTLTTLIAGKFAVDDDVTRPVI